MHGVAESALGESHDGHAKAQKSRGTRVHPRAEHSYLVGSREGHVVIALVVLRR